VPFTKIKLVLVAGANFFSKKVYRHSANGALLRPLSDFRHDIFQPKI